MSETGTEAAPPSRLATFAPGRFFEQQGRITSLIEVVVLYALCIGGALFLSALLVEATGGSWTAVFGALLDGSVRNPGRIGTTIGVAVPLLVVALGTIINSKAGLVNIGQEGQLFIGAAFATYVGVEMPGPGPVVVVALVIAGIIGGAIWAGIAAVLKYWRSVPEVLSTLLMVTIAAQLVGYGLKNQWLLLAPSEGAGQPPADQRAARRRSAHTEADLVRERVPQLGVRGPAACGPGRVPVQPDDRGLPPTHVGVEPEDRPTRRGR